MSKKKKIMLLTNPPWLKTGLAENGKYLAEYLEKTGKYDLIYYCQQVSVLDPHHAQMPWKSIGCIPADQQTVQQLQQDQGRARWAAYGNMLIDNVVNEVKPDVLWASDDIWSFPDLHKKSWAEKLNLVLHITVDSKPILPLAYEQAKACKNFYTWAKFASDEIKLQGKDFAHVKQIYGMSNTNIYSPITKQEKSGIRKEFNLNEKTVIIGYVFRNQLRKSAPELLMAFKEFKRENPYADVKIHLHTSVSEMQNGWDFPRLMDEYKINKTDILFTYFCKNCKRWEVKPYVGEDLNCRYCKAEKTVITPNIADGVADEEMRYVYGLWDASISPITSGGMEYHNVQSLLCGMPLASTNYSSGQDFAAQSFVYSINWHPRGEAGTSFTKSTNDINSIRNYINKIYKMSQRDRDEMGEKGREWAIKTFSPEVIGKQWENVFDALPDVDSSKITLEVKAKNDSYPNPSIENDFEWIKALYKNILNMEVPDNDSGLLHWSQVLKSGKSRQEVYNYFIGVAREENNKTQKPVDFSSVLDKNGKKRALFVMKESIGDITICTQLFEDFHNKHPNTDLYVGIDPKYADVLIGNPYIHKVLPYQPFFEQEMACCGAGQGKDSELFHYYFHPGILTQRHLQYLYS
jgi:glycosyltransferase involved in cell wall biosynthesis